jgi:hypothetical protein
LIEESFDMKYAIIFVVKIPRIESTPDGGEGRSQRGREAIVHALALFQRVRGGVLQPPALQVAAWARAKPKASPFVHGPHRAWVRALRVPQNGEVPP